MRKQSFAISLAALVIFLTTFVLVPANVYCWPWDEKPKSESKKKEAPKKDKDQPEVRSYTKEELEEAGIQTVVKTDYLHKTQKPIKTDYISNIPKPVKTDYVPKVQKRITPAQEVVRPFKLQPINQLPKVQEPPPVPNKEKEEKES